jgi:hypothetical protein
MTDPYTALGRQLAAAADRLESHGTTNGRVRAWLSHRLNAAAVAAALVLGGAAVAAAATGLLSGAPVKPEVAVSPAAGNGVPVSGSIEHLLLSVADPAGGLPWGMRVFRTTRGQICAQVGRVQGGQLGELGLDSAFGSDGRFHALPADVLPPGYGGSSGQIECLLAGQTVIVEDANADRSAMRLLPEEFRVPPKFRESPKNPKHREIVPPTSDIPPTGDLRALAYGLLGPHAVSVTYRTTDGLKTVPVHGREGAFLIVEPAGYIKSHSLVGGSFGGQATASSVEVTPLSAPNAGAMISAVAFRFGAKLCSQGTGSPIHMRCPTHRVYAPRRWLTPTRSLHAPVHLTLLRQSPAACKAAFLLDPCYRGEVEFTAPYAVTTAATDYEIQAHANCKLGGRPETGWSLERDVRRNEVIRTVSLVRFVFAPSCAAHESFEVSYRNLQGPSAAAPHESVIIGTVSMSSATRPNGAPVAVQSPSSMR